MKIYDWALEAQTNSKLISNFSQNKIELKRAEFKTSAVINMYFIGPNKNFKLLKCERMIAFFCVFSLSKKQLVNKVKMEQIIVFMRNCESAVLKKGMFFSGELRFSLRVSHGSKNLGV